MSILDKALSMQRAFVTEADFEIEGVIDVNCDQLTNVGYGETGYNQHVRGLLNYCADYAASEFYRFNDVVTEVDNLYVCIDEAGVMSTGPPNASFWAPLATNTPLGIGDTGPTGMGPQGATGPSPMGPTGVAGMDAQNGPTGSTGTTGAIGAQGNGITGPTGPAAGESIAHLLVSMTGTHSANNQTFQVIPGMTLTGPTGTYYVTFSSSCSFVSPSSSLTVELARGVALTQVVGSVRITSNANANQPQTIIQAIYTQSVVDISPSDPVSVLAQSGGNTYNIFERTMYAERIG